MQYDIEYAIRVIKMVGNVSFLTDEQLEYCYLAIAENAEGEYKEYYEKYYEILGNELNKRNK